MQALSQMASENQSRQPPRRKVGGVDPQRVAEVQKRFRDQGVNLREWAKANGVKEKLAYEVFSGRRSCLRGESHRVAVLMGLKDAPASAPAAPGSDLN